MTKKLITFGAFLILLTACDKGVENEDSSAKGQSIISAESGGSNAPTEPAVHRHEEKPAAEGDGTQQDIAEPITRFDDLEAAVIEPEIPQPIQRHPVGLDGLRLSDGQQQEIDQWIAERQDEEAVNPAKLLQHIKSILDEEQREAFTNMIEASGRSFESENE